MSPLNAVGLTAIGGMADVKLRRAHELKALNGHVPPATALEAITLASSSTTDDLDEGINAFRRKRPREFKGQ